MAREVRRDTISGPRQGNLFFLSFLVGNLLLVGTIVVLVLTGGDPVLVCVAIPVALLVPVVTLSAFQQKGYRCRVCGSRCEKSPDRPAQLRHLCTRCNIEWTEDTPNWGA